METISERAKKNAEATGLGKYLHLVSQIGPYDPTSNPNGIVDLGVSENRLIEDMIKDKMEQIKTNNQWRSSFQYYFNFQGIVELRHEIVKFFEDNFVKTESSSNERLSIDNIVVMNGAGSCFTALSHCIMDENDFLMIHTPYYSGIGFDINAITNNNIYPVNSYSSNDFRLTIDDYQNALNQSKIDGKNVKAICIVNPQNPLGFCYSKKHVMDLLEFARDQDLHVIIDEVYANCIYDKNQEFQSAFSYYNQFPNPSKTHFIWSFSKDFCLAGMRTGVIYSTNQTLVKTLTTLGYLFAPSYLVQYNLAQMLNDKKWVNDFIDLNLKRLKSSKQRMLDELGQFDIKIYECDSGFYLWVDFRNIFGKIDSHITQNMEKRLFELFLEYGVYIVPGQFLKSPEFGFYRVIFSQPDYLIVEGCKRMRLAIQSFISNATFINNKD